MNLTRFRLPAKPVPACDLTVAILISRKSRYSISDSLVVDWPSSAYELIGAPAVSADSAASRRDSNQLNRSDAERAMPAYCIGYAIGGMLLFQTSGTKTGER